MLREIGDGHVRLTFDQGRLEIMSPSGFHEDVKKSIARLLEAYADEAGIVLEGLGSTTYSREDLQKGLEPDECYYIANAPAIIGKRELDLAVDPPPDLAIEVDISPPGVARQPIYAALGVPEIWRYDGRRLVCLHRHTEPATGPRYVPADKSLSFPQLSLADFNRFIEIAISQGQSAAVRELRQWMRSK
ncbi:MAG TPA: Uma2 family endonuclease [Humisphaera sp.]|nr:Uma2 family endonuclease [Humisphaera sp.]